MNNLVVIVAVALEAGILWWVLPRAIRWTRTIPPRLTLGSLILAIIAAILLLIAGGKLMLWILAQPIPK